MPQGSPQDEYRHTVGNNLRYQTIRFTLLLVSIAVSTHLLTVLAATSRNSAQYLTITLEIVGVATTFLFWVLHERTMLYWNHFVRRAAELEASLGCCLYSSHPQVGLITANHSVRLLCLVVGLCWLATILWLR